MNAGPEAEFFPVPDEERHRDDGDARRGELLRPRAPSIRARTCGGEIVLALEAMGFHVEAARSRGGAGPARNRLPLRRRADDGRQHQHVQICREKHRDAKRPARHVQCPSRSTASTDRGMHTHMSLFSGGTNIFYDAKAHWQLSEDLPELHRRDPAPRGKASARSPTRWEFLQAARAGIRGADQHRVVREESQPARPRSGDARHVDADRAADAGSLVQSVPRAGRDVAVRPGRDREETRPGPPVNKNIYKMSHRERRHLRIDELPGNLNEALDELEKDDLVRETLGEHLFEHFVAAKREEWQDYIKHVSPWEVDRYLGMY